MVKRLELTDEQKDRVPRGASGSKRFTDLPESDVLCDSCGYCLRGQPATGTCPECGVAVGRSAMQVADRLAGTVALTGSTDNRRRSDLRWGPWLILAAIGLTVVAMSLPYSGMGEMVKICIWMASWILAFVGVYASTRPAKGIRQPIGMRWLRSVLCFLALMCVILPIASIIIMLQSHFPYNTLKANVVSPLEMYAAIAAVLGTFLYYFYGFWIARLNDQRSVMVSTVVCMIVITVLAGVMLASNWLALNDPLMGWFSFTPYIHVSWRPLSLSGGPIGITVAPYFVSLATGAQWILPLTLLQLALMPGRVRTEDLTGKSAASSRA